MTVHELLKSSYSFDEAKQLQIKYRSKIIEEQKDPDFFIEEKSIKYLIGVDISYYKRENQDYGIASAVLWNYKKQKMIETYFSGSIIDFPYKAGYLGYRENGLIAKAIKMSKITPDLLMCDGHGIIHPRRFGEATHLGVALNIPSMGVAKNPFFGFYDFQNLKRIKGTKSPIWREDPQEISSKNNEKIGYAVILSNEKKPVFVSPGYKIRLEVALNIALNTTSEHRQPEPLFFADHLSRKRIKNN
jgi:deoxyribonuclease V